MRSYCQSIPCIRRVKSTPDPDTFEKYRDTPPISMAYFCKSMPSSWQKVVYTPPICIAIRLPFVSRYFCRSIRVRGRWDTPNCRRSPSRLKSAWVQSLPFSRQSFEQLAFAPLLATAKIYLRATKSLRERFEQELSAQRGQSQQTKQTS